MGVIIWLIGFVAAAIGTLLANFIVSLDIINFNELVTAVIWFLIALTTYYAGRRIESETWFKLLSLNFILTWVFCTMGVLLGDVAWELIKTSGVTLNSDNLVTLFFASLPFAIGPTAAMSIGLRDQ